ncbi:MAG: restriction endonuclease subunit S [Candidatus Cloacimonetes bacterium]|nr:restriction endonuclease subunit S [Candidatus Cloacimonadota bacterium]
MRKVKLKELCFYQNGYAFKSNHLEKEKIDENYLPVIKIGSFKENNIELNLCQYAKYSENLLQYLILKNDILIAMTGATVGKAILIKEENSYLLNQRVGIIRPKSELFYKYLYHLIKNESFYNFCQEVAGGGAQGNISHDQILEYEIPLPDTYEEQITIADKLDKQMAAIEKMRKATLKQKEAAKAMESSILLEVFPCLKAEKISNVCKINKINNYPSKSEKCLLYSIEAYDTNKEPEEILVKELGSEKNICETGNILFCKMNPRKNRVWHIKDKRDLPMLCSSEFVPLIPSDVDSEYLTLYLSSNYFTNQLKQYIKGATKSRSRVNPTDLMKTKIPLPDRKGDQNKIALILNAKLNEIKKIRKQLANQLIAIDSLPASILRETFEEV